MIKENDIIIATGVDYNSDGIGVAKHENETIFVTNLIIGETAEIKITKVKRNFSIGKIVRLIKQSEDRIAPRIKETIHLGGCQFTQLAYEKEVEHKKAKVERALRVIGGKELEIKQIIKAEQPYFYRNKTVLPLGTTKSGKVISGLYRFRTHEIVAMKQTHLDSEVSATIIATIKQLITKFNYTVYNEQTHKGTFRKVMVRTSHYTDDVLVVLITKEAEIARLNEFVSELVHLRPEITGVVQNINSQRTNVILGENEKLLFGKGYIKENLLGLTFTASSKSFLQINTIQAERLYERALTLAELTVENVVLDAYAGTGTLTLLASRKVKHAIGVEIVKEAVNDAKRNAMQNNITNASFYENDVTNFLINHEAAKTVDTIIVDPPRKGLTTDFIKTAMKQHIRKFVYISCNPATLARDLRLLLDKFEIVALEAVDMFPRTPHVETITVLKRK